MGGRGAVVLVLGLGLVLLNLFYSANGKAIRSTIVGS